MNTQNTNAFWENLRNTWNTQPESEQIIIETDQLIQAFKAKLSVFEKNAIKNDWKFITASISDFEKQSIQNDLAFWKTLFNRIKAKFKNK